MELTVPCDEAEAYYNYVPIYVMELMHGVSSIIAIITVCYTIKAYLPRTIFGRPFMEILIALYIGVLIQSVCSIGTQLTLVIAHHLADVPCHAQISKKFCIFRVLNVSMTSFLVVVHVTLTVNRLISTFTSNECKQAWTGKACLAIGVLYSAFVPLAAFWGEQFQGTTMYCLGVTSSNTAVHQANYDILLGLDVASVATECILLKYNRKSYDLRSTFHRKQIIYAIEHFLPVTAVHAVCYFVQWGAYTYGFTIFPSMKAEEKAAAVGFMNLVPYYCALAPLILLLQMRRGRSGRIKAMQRMVGPAERRDEDHIRTLKSQWAGAMDKKEEAEANRISQFMIVPA